MHSKTGRNKDKKDIIDNRETCPRKNIRECWQFRCSLQKGFPTQHTFYYQLGEGGNVVIITNKETDFENLPHANTSLRVFIDFHIFLIGVRHPGPHFTGRETEDQNNGMSFQGRTLSGELESNEISGSSYYTLQRPIFVLGNTVTHLEHYIKTIPLFSHFG